MVPGGKKSKLEVWLNMIKVHWILKVALVSGVLWTVEPQGCIQGPPEPACLFFVFRFWDQRFNIVIVTVYI